MALKLYFPPPILLENISEEILTKTHFIGILALNQQKQFFIICDLMNESLWKEYWLLLKISKDPKNLQNLKSKHSILNSKEDFSKKIINAFNSIMGMNLIFIGIIHFDSNVFDHAILTEGVFFKTKTRIFSNMILTYRETNKFPLLHNKEFIEIQVIGQGEQFFNSEKLTFQQMAYMTQHFQGSFYGILGELDQHIVLTILSQNITSESTVFGPKLDKKGRDTLLQLVKKKSFHPAGGFRFDYGFYSLKLLNEWNSLENNKEFQDSYNLIQQYQTATSKGEKFSLPKITYSPLFGVIPEDSRKREEKVNVDPDLNIETKSNYESPTEKFLNSIPKAEIVSNTPNIKQDLQNSLSKLKLAVMNPLEKIESLKIVEKEKDIYEYEDEFNPAEVTVQKSDLPEINQELQEEAEAILSADTGRQVDISLMSHDQIMQDLKESLDAISHLDEMAETDAAVNRLYYPPPTLIAKATKSGMEIGGSTCLIVMDAGRNLWNISELKRMQMWGEFYKDITGNPQIEDFVAMDEKEITEVSQLEDILQKSFKKIYQNQWMFIGLIEIESNGFEASVFKECPLPGPDIEKLMNIHIAKRNSMNFPELAQEGFIEMKYIGKYISFFSNRDNLSIKDIAKNMIEIPALQKGILTGIICVEQDTALFFILSNNFDQLEKEEPEFIIDSNVVNKMYEMMETMNLTPVSWFKISFGFKALNSLIFWDEIQNNPVGLSIKKEYDQYFHSFLK